MLIGLYKYFLTIGDRLCNTIIFRKQIKMSYSDSQLLAIVFDVNPVWWGLETVQGRTTITKCLDCILVFANSYLMMNTDNSLVVLASHTSQTKFLFPRRDNTINTKQHDGRYQKFADVSDTVIEEFKALMSVPPAENEIRNDSLIAGSMAVALCYIHRIERDAPLGKKPRSRILVINAANDAAAQYMSVMNVVFAAQKQHVAIDSLVLGQDSGLLQQACDMTGGLYIRVPNQQSVLQYLLTAFLVNPDVRQQSLTLSSVGEKSSNVDYRAACFCHRNFVDVGFVCSVCLSIFCHFSPICSTCESAFRPPPTLASKAKKKKKS